MIFGGYVEVRESLYTRVLIFGSMPFYAVLILGRFCLRMKVLDWSIGPNGIENKNILKYTYPAGCIKCGILIDTKMVSNKDNTRPTLVLTLTRTPRTTFIHNLYEPLQVLKIIDLIFKGSKLYLECSCMSRR